MMLGVAIGAWSGLPVEVVCLWLAVSLTTVITYEVIKIWKALGTGALEAFFGIKKQPYRAKRRKQGQVTAA